MTEEGAVHPLAGEVAEHLRQEFAGVYDEARVQAHVRDYLGTAIAREQVQRLSQRVSPGSSVLDVGCGYGAFVEEAVAAGYEAVGLEFTHFELSVSCRRLKGLPANLVGGSGLALPFKDGSFDAVTLWNVVEHVPDADELIREAARVLRSQGWLLAVAPNYASFRTEPHYHLPWVPMFPRKLADRYLRKCGRDPHFLHSSIYYSTNRGVRRALRASGLRAHYPKAAKLTDASLIRGGVKRRFIGGLQKWRLLNAALAGLEAWSSSPFTRTIDFDARKDG